MIYVGAQQNLRRGYFGVPVRFQFTLNEWQLPRQVFYV